MQTSACTHTRTHRACANSVWLFPGSGAGAHVCVPAGQLQELQTPVEVCRGEPRLLPATPTNHGQGQPKRLHTTRVPLQIQVEHRDGLTCDRRRMMQHMGNIACHIKQRLCIYGYSVSMVTWICSYGDWHIPFILFVFSSLWLWEMVRTSSHTWRALPAICRSGWSVFHFGVCVLKTQVVEVNVIQYNWYTNVTDFEPFVNSQRNML